MFVCLYTNDLLIKSNNEIEISLFKCKMKKVFGNDKSKAFDIFPRHGIYIHFKRHTIASKEVNLTSKFYIL